MSESSTMPTDPEKKEEERPARTTVDDPCWGGPEPERHDLPFLLRRIEEGAFGGGDGVSEHDDDGSIGRGDVGDSGEIIPPANAEFSTTTDERRRRRRRSGSKQQLVLYEDEDYVALNKPPDLRMDGPCPATVHKLLTYWYPSPSLLERASVAAGGAAAAAAPIDPSAESSLSAAESVPATVGDFDRSDVDDDDGGANDSALLAAVAELSVHNSLHDNALRPAHQLDYATSGVLLIGRSRKAAAHACRAFQDRTTQKAYLAVAHGHIDVGGMTVLERGGLDRWTDGSEERQYRRRRKKEGKGKGCTFEGYMPPHAVFQKWRWARTRAARESERAGKARDGDAERGEPAQKRKRNGKAAANRTESALEIVPPLDEKDAEALMGMKWAGVKKNSKWKQVFQDMSDRFNSTLNTENGSSEGPSVTKSKNGADSSPQAELNCKEPNSTPLPNLFRLADDALDSFYVHAATAEVKGEFRCRVRASECADTAHGRRCASFCGADTDSGDDGSADSLEYKPSLTRCRILWSGLVRGCPVTKLRLEPRTGRRHQLRLHLAAVTGCPIVGDVAYGGGLGEAEAVREAEGKMGCRRMCLHAHSLSLPGMDETSGARMEFVAPDPFPVREGGAGEDGTESVVLGGRFDSNGTKSRRGG